ncbi:hypothetical protein Hbor_05570 [Halogeometricum borinquense DSM 11551]|uniref:Uncharacterized protein n=1 Tax=Halogeometricum borinquense (strain ATCC 700274 / DSM 11551 / JCM 10706 / KCTC 4070 / PR3) TaxID=469382 RepID=E4NM59_HALBP|nr:hypothetical protein Hbor_05570 [Halogeometricum borinquense DSM 11551]
MDATLRSADSLRYCHRAVLATVHPVRRSGVRLVHLAHALSRLAFLHSDGDFVFPFAATPVALSDDRFGDACVGVVTLVRYGDVAYTDMRAIRYR